MSEVAGGTVGAEQRQLKRSLVSAGSFWLIVPGVGCVLLALMEGSPVWATFILSSAYLGFAGGLAGGDSLRAKMQSAAESGYKPTTGEMLRGVFGIQALLLFWIPQMLFLTVSIEVAHALPGESAPRSLKDTSALVTIESLATYFVTIGAAWYKTWQWRRTLPRA